MRPNTRVTKLDPFELAMLDYGEGKRRQEEEDATLATFGWVLLLISLLALAGFGRLLWYCLTA